VRALCLPGRRFDPAEPWPGGRQQRPGATALGSTRSLTVPADQPNAETEEAEVAKATYRSTTEAADPSTQNVRTLGATNQPSDRAVLRIGTLDAIIGAGPVAMASFAGSAPILADEVRAAWRTDTSSHGPTAPAATPAPGPELDRHQAPWFPRGYCPVVRHCWEKAGYKFRSSTTSRSPGQPRPSEERHRGLAELSNRLEEAVETTTE
jgi:hypothetical protein